MSDQSILTVVTAAPNYDLTDLVTVKSELSIKATDTSNDTFLASGITDCSAVIQQYCNRVFAVESLSEIIWIDRVTPRRVGPEGTRVQLSRWPIVSISSVVIDAGLSGETTLVAGTDYILDPKLGQILRIDANTGLPNRWVARSVTVAYLAGYGTLTTQVVSVPSVSPYTVTVTNSAEFSVDQGVKYDATKVALTPVVSSPSIGQYVVNPATGTYTFAAADAGAAMDISYAYNVIEGALETGCLRLVTARFRARGRDPFLRGESIAGVGAPQYWIGALPGQDGALTPEVQALVNSYRAIPS